MSSIPSTSVASTSSVAKTPSRLASSAEPIRAIRVRVYLTPEQEADALHVGTVRRNAWNLIVAEADRRRRENWVWDVVQDPVRLAQVLGAGVSEDVEKKQKKGPKTKIKPKPLVSVWLHERILAFQGVYPSAEPEPSFHRGNLSDWLTEVIQNGNAWALVHVAGWAKAKAWDTQVQALEAHLDQAFPWVRAGRVGTKKRLQAVDLRSSERWLDLFHGARQGLASAEAPLPRRLVTRLPRRERAGLMQEWHTMSGSICTARF